MSNVKRYLMIGAHPDDADIRFGGTALKLTRAGHLVKFVSMCNGDCGHFDMTISHEELAERYANEMRMVERVPDALSGAMGNMMFLAVFDTQEELDAFYRDAVECV